MYFENGRLCAKKNGGRRTCQRARESHSNLERQYEIYDEVCDGTYCIQDMLGRPILRTWNAYMLGRPILCAWLGFVPRLPYFLLAHTHTHNRTHNMQAVHGRRAGPAPLHTASVLRDAQAPLLVDARSHQYNSASSFLTCLTLQYFSCVQDRECFDKIINFIIFKIHDK